MSEIQIFKAGEVNLFQRIKALCAELKEKGIVVIALTIGEPKGPAFLEARKAAAAAIMSDSEDMHIYQDNGEAGCPGFAEEFVGYHVSEAVRDSDYVEYVPLKGIKGSLGIIINAMGGFLRTADNPVKVATMTNPGYPTPREQCEMIKGVKHYELPLDPENGFLFDPKWLLDQGFGSGDLVMLNLPHNPTGASAEDEWLHKICTLCAEHGIRIFNDAAYGLLYHAFGHSMLADIAIQYEELGWAEAFSASKLGNFTAWSIAAAVGSPGFIKDIKQVKGKTDSGFMPALAHGVLEVCRNHMGLIVERKEQYGESLQTLKDVMCEAGIVQAIEPTAGFFAFFNCPKYAFGQEIEDAEHFNNLMANETCLVGVPFGPWIRYAVCKINVDEFVDQIRAGLAKANPSY